MVNFLKAICAIAGTAIVVYLCALFVWPQYPYIMEWDSGARLFYLFTVIIFVGPVLAMTFTHYP